MVAARACDVTVSGAAVLEDVTAGEGAEDFEVVGEVVGDEGGATATPFAMVLVAAQPELAGGGCAGGVTGCPWKKVEEP